MVKISVIIPVYNVEDYLEETMDSLINQTMFDDIEILMIDDGSTDDSRFLIEKYSLDYDNIRTFHKINEGQGVARNYGLTLAKGDYIHFMDSDDYLPPDAYEKLYGMAVKNDFKNDIILGNLLRFRRYNAWESILFKNCFKDIHEEIPSTTLNETHAIVWDTITCNKLYKKEFLEKNDIKFIEDKTFYEDILFSFKSYLCADSIAMIPDVIYYWRVRREMSSTTQQLNTVKNFTDRLKILNLCHDLIEENNISGELLDKLFHKWLINDFKGNLREIQYFPRETAEELVGEINKFLAIIPKRIRENLNSYHKILYDMVENNDIDGLVKFAHLEKDLKLNPHVPDDLDEKYHNNIDFISDGADEDLKVEVMGVDHDDSCIYLGIEEQINYVFPNHPHQTQAFLIYGSDEFPLEFKDNRIILPVDLIRDKNHFNIKMKYMSDSFTLEGILRSDRRHSITFEDFDVDIGIGMKHFAYFDIQNKTNNRILISDVSFEDDEFVFKGKCDSKISEVFISNVISFNKIVYPVKTLNANEFTFTIPYPDVLKAVVKKWEINCSDSLNSIELEDKFKFYTKTSRITFTNARNKILITEDISNPVVSLYQEIDKFNEAKYKYLNALDRNKKLNEKIDRLNSNLEEFKSRKVVKFADKFKL